MPIAELDDSPESEVLAARLYHCKECKDAIKQRRYQPGESWTCPLCQCVVQTDPPASNDNARRPAGPLAIEMGYWCGNDLLWYTGAAAEIARHEASVGPAPLRSPLARLILEEKRPSEMFRRMGVDNSAAGIATRRTRLEIIEQTMDKIFARDHVQYNLLVSVFVRRNASIECKVQTWWVNVAKESVPDVAQQMSRRPSALAAWTCRATAAAVERYDLAHG